MYYCWMMYGIVGSAGVRQWYGVWSRCLRHSGSSRWLRRV